MKRDMTLICHDTKYIRICYDITIKAKAILRGTCHFPEKKSATKRPNRVGLICLRAGCVGDELSYFINRGQVVRVQIVSG